ncbi:MAG: glutamate--tRNA ligase [Dehalococcoidia bacterium]|nr:glutamate--tRNA ligase [Dehalococcoidia bacterium]
MQSSNTSEVRVRYAPSPTGHPHVGNIRTALFNWLYARHTGGRFILRIEDTDAARIVPGAQESIYSSLRWLGLDWDEGPEAGGDFGPYVQSQRLDLYRDAVGRLLKSGNAYKCYCSSERLDQMRAEQAKQKVPPGYDRRCRNLTPEQGAEFEKSGITPVVRFAMPLDGVTAFNDIIRGQVTFENRIMDDFVIMKSDGFPTYHLASIVDDHAMRISHVLRAEEWLSSTPKHMLLYAAFGWQPPLFAHLPMILGPDRSKLSKRHGATSTVEYRDAGFLTEAMVNFLALLGWSLDDKTELLSREELVKVFSLERISKTAAIFDRAKLEWMNGVYMRQLRPMDFAGRAIPFLERDLPVAVPRPLDLGYVARLAPLLQERARTLSECAELAGFFFVEELSYDAKLLLGKDTTPGVAVRLLGAALDKLERLEPFDAPTMEPMLRALAVELDVKTGALFGLLRTATTGRTAAPPLFQTMDVLGKERSLKRIRAAIAKVG